MALKLRAQIYFAGLLFAGTSLAFADPATVVDPHSGSVWQSWTASQISNQPWATSQQTPNQPYWNNSSWDGTNENVGGCLAKAGSGCAVSNQPGAIPYLDNRPEMPLAISTSPATGGYNHFGGTEFSRCV